jgi:hypothetical protein
MILVHSIGKGYGLFKRNRGLNICYSFINLDILLRNALEEGLVASIAKLWAMKF